MRLSHSAIALILAYTANASSMDTERHTSTITVEVKAIPTGATSETTHPDSYHPPKDPHHDSHHRTFKHGPFEAKCSTKTHGQGTWRGAPGNNSTRDCLSAGAGHMFGMASNPGECYHEAMDAMQKHLHTTDPNDLHDKNVGDVRKHWKDTPAGHKNHTGTSNINIPGLHLKSVEKGVKDIKDSVTIHLSANDKLLGHMDFRHVTNGSHGFVHLPPKPKQDKPYSNATDKRNFMPSEDQDVKFSYASCGDGPRKTDAQNKDNMNAIAMEMMGWIGGHGKGPDGHSVQMSNTGNRSHGMFGGLFQAGKEAKSDDYDPSSLDMSHCHGK